MGEEVDEVVSATWVVPVEPDVILPDHSVAVRGGKIVAIVPTADVLTKYKPREHTQLPASTALLPGFVNAHTHSPMTLLRGVSDDVGRVTEWLQTTIFPLEGKFVGPEFVKDGAELAIMEMLLSGTTTFNDMYFFSEAIAEVVKRAGIRATLNIIAIEFPSKYASGMDEYLAKGQAAREAFRGEDLITWSITPHAPYTVSDASFVKVRDLREKLGCRVHTHLHETDAEVAESVAGNKEAIGVCHMSDEKCSPLANLRRLGLVNEHLVAVHMTCLSDEEVAWCSEAKVHVVHCPTSNLKLASGFCRVADLAAAGVNVALGTDGASSNNSLDMMAEMKLAAILQKAVSKNPAALPAREALRMATLNGAKAMGISDVTGSLVVGKEADMIAVSFRDPAVWPAPNVADKPGFDPVTHLVYSSTRSQVTDAWVKGRRLMKERQVLTLSQASIEEASKRWATEITNFLKSDMK